MIFVDLVVPAVLARGYPGYSTLHQTISTLSTRESPVRLAAAIALGLEGLLVLGYAAWAVCHLGVDSAAKRWFVGGISVFAIGTVIAAMAPEDPWGTAETASGRIHGIASGIGFVLIMISMLATWWIREVRTGRSRLLMLFVAAIVTFVLFLASEDVTTGWLSLTGLYQRLNLIVIYVGLGLVAWSVSAAQPEAEVTVRSTQSIGRA